MAAVTHNEDGHEAGQGCVPVTTGCRRGLSHQHTIEDKVSQAQFHTP